MSNTKSYNDRLSRAIAETKEYLQLNVDAEADDSDALEELEDECGMQHDGTCLYVGTEECDWDCPFS